MFMHSAYIAIGYWIATYFRALVGSHFLASFIVGFYLKPPILVQKFLVAKNLSGIKFEISHFYDWKFKCSRLFRIKSCCHKKLQKKAQNDWRNNLNEDIPNLKLYACYDIRSLLSHQLIICGFMIQTQLWGPILSRISCKVIGFQNVLNSRAPPELWERVRDTSKTFP